MAIKPIQILINAKDNASEVFDKLQTKIAAVGAAIVGYFGVRAFVGVVKGAADLEQAMSRVQAATGATGDEMVRLRAAAEGAASGTKFSAVDTAAALENLAKAGLSAADAIAALPAVMSLAGAGDIELGQSAEFVTKAVMGMGLAFSDAGRVADVLALGANATNTSVTGLAQALSYAAPVAQSLGLSLESTVAIIGKFADAGIDASRAGTALNGILSQFSNPATKFRQELAAAGITTTNFEEALHQLAASGARGERAINSIGQEAGPALRALLNQGMGSLDALGEKLRNAQGSAAATAATMRDNLTGAMGGLRSAWDAVSNALGTPVLPVLQAGVEKLTSALSGAVKDGTVAKFGQAIATAFEGGIKWVKEFIGTVDFAEVTTRVQAFADRTGELFTSIGESARTASNVAQTAWGVMVAGTNIVLAAVYTIAEAFAGVARDVSLGIALLNEGLAKVTFGAMSANFAKEAEAVRATAGALGAVSEEFSKRAGEAFDRAAAGAANAREGFAGLTDGAKEAGAAAVATAAKYGTVVQGLIATAEAAGVAKQKANEAAAAQKDAADKTVEAVTRLRDEYAKAIQTGNLQLAIEKLKELKKVTDDAANAADGNSRKQKEAAQAIAAAFERAGLQTKDALRVAAQTAKSDFELIRDSGQASADAIAAAWQKSADAAIAANEGVVPYWVSGEAAAKGYAVQVDEAGKATLQLVQTSAALKGLAGGFDAATASASRYSQSLSGPTPGSPASGGGGGGGSRRGGDRHIKSDQEDLPPGIESRNGQIGFVDAQGRFISTGDDNRGKAPGEFKHTQQEIKPVTGKDRDERLAGQNAVDANLQFQLRDKLKLGQLTSADLGDMRAVVASLKQNNELNGSASKMNAGFMSLDGQRDAQAWQQTMAQFEQAIARLTPRAPSVSHYTIENKTTSLNFSDEESAAAAEALIRQLTGGKGTHQ